MDQVIDLRHYADEDCEGGKLTWVRRMFHALVESPRCPKWDMQQLDTWLADPKDDPHFETRLRGIVDWFRKAKSSLLIFLTIPFENDRIEADVRTLITTI